MQVLANVPRAWECPWAIEPNQALIPSRVLGVEPRSEVGILTKTYLP